jgi:hypothetical protein
MYHRRVRRALALFTLLAAAGTAGCFAVPVDATAETWPPGVIVTASGTVKVTVPGTIVDGKEIHGGLYVLADDVTVRNTRVFTDGAYYGVRVPPEFHNATVDHVDVTCTTPTANGVAFGNYRAVGVNVRGCKNAFITSPETVIVASTVDGQRVDAPALPTPDAPALPPPVTTLPPPVTTLPPPVTPPPPVTAPSGTTPDFGAIEAAAGLSDPSRLTRSGPVTVKTPGAVVENLDVDGGITVNADNVTIRNVRVRGSSSSLLVKVNRGFRGTRIEHCEVFVTAGGANGAIGSLGSGTTVRACDISGYADGIKADSGSLYELNHIHMSKPSGSTKHLDGIQSSGDSNVTIRNNVIDADIANGGNAAVFAQAFNGTQNIAIENVVVVGNLLAGGNYTVFFEGGKTYDGTAPGSWVRGYQLLGNSFVANARYGPFRAANCAETTVSGNIMTNGSAFRAACAK